MSGSEPEKWAHAFTGEETTDEWSTPPSLLRPLSSAVNGFDLDPCSGAEENPLAETTYSESDDGLSRPWFGTVFCNPPYSDVETWARNALRENQRDAVETIVFLVPSRTSTQRFHRYVTQASTIVFLEGRLRFGNNPIANAPFPSLIAVFGECPDDLHDVLDRRGAVYDSTHHSERAEQRRLVQ